MTRQQSEGIRPVSVLLAQVQLGGPVTTHPAAILDLQQGWLFLAALGRGVRAARVEGAARRRVGRVGDLTGDGLNDLAIIVHDRVLLYPQE